MNIERFAMYQGYNHGFSPAYMEGFGEFNARVQGFTITSHVENSFNNPWRRDSYSSNISVTHLLSKINNEIDLNQIAWGHCEFPKKQGAGGNQVQANKSDCLNSAYSEKLTVKSKIKKWLQNFFLPCVR